MNYSQMNFSNNFVSMHQMSSATKVVGNVQADLPFIPSTSTQVCSAVIQHQPTAIQAHWSCDTVKVNLSDYSQIMERPSRTVVMQSVSTMTDFETPAAVTCKANQRESISSDYSEDSSKSITTDNVSNGCAQIDLTRNANAMADYLNRLQPLSIPEHIQEFLKRENVKVLTDLNKTEATEQKKYSEESDNCKPEVRISTALDGATLYCCSLCHMAYPHKDSLEQHHSVHKGERKYECNVCGVYLKRKEHLDQHKRGHSEERPFVCEVCCKGFKRNEHLRRHAVIHSGNKSHVCTVCTKAFSRKDHLSKHLHIHMGKRVHQLHNNHKLVTSN